MQVDGAHAGQIRRLHEKVRCALLMCKKVTDGLHGRTVVCTRQLEGEALALPLKLHACEHPAAEILRADLHEKRGVRHARIALIAAHAVRRDAGKLGGCRNDLPARAHAEGVRAPAAQLVLIREAVVGDRQAHIPGILCVLRAIDESLWMLNAHAHGKRLRLQKKAARKKHLVCVARRVSNGEESCSSLHTLLAVDDEREERAVFQLDVCHLRQEANLAAQAADLLTDVLNDVAQEVGADMRLVQILDLFGCARRHESVEHLAHERVADARHQLAVGKRPRTALTELDVGAHIERSRLPEMLDRCMTRLDVIAAL